MTAARIAGKGIYDIPMEQYHGDCCEGPSVSGSGLVTIEQKSLAHYWWDSYHNPNQEPRDTTALAFGRACHAWTLGEPEWNKYFILSPYDDFRTKEARTWREAQTRTIVKAEQFEAIKVMTDQLRRHPLLKNAFTDGRPEMSLIWKDRETGIWLKSRPDWLPNTSRFVPNFKTCASAKPDAFTRAAFGFGYHQGAALCLDGLREVLGWNDAQYYFVAQEKEPPYVALPFVMRDTDIEMGRMLNRSALRKLARALDADHWPAYAEGAVEICMPAWTEKQILDRGETGEFNELQKDEAE